MPFILSFSNIAKRKKARMDKVFDIFHISNSSMLQCNSFFKPYECHIPLYNIRSYHIVARAIETEHNKLWEVAGQCKGNQCDHNHENRNLEINHGVTSVFIPIWFPKRQNIRYSFLLTNKHLFPWFHYTESEGS